MLIGWFHGQTVTGTFGATYPLGLPPGPTPGNKLLAQFGGRCLLGSDTVDDAMRFDESNSVKAELTAIIEEAPEGGYWAICAEVPGANGQGESVEQAKQNLCEAIRLIFEDRVADIKRGLPKDAIEAVIGI